jgi:phosphoglycolate phosphatase-like HAD superfamily hydrolase
MTDPQAPLRNLKAEHKFFVGIDSDGCAFDTMEPKHKECFCPVFIWKFNLAAVSKYAREGWDFVNLYSKTRGCNRFHAVERVLDLLAEREEVKARKVHIPEMKEMRNWTRRETKLGNPVLEAEVKSTGSKEMAMLLDWSKTVNEMVAKIVREVPPFPGVRESLVKLSKQADVMVVSATPGEALVREWNEHDIAGHVKVIAGQEMGTKAEHLKLAAVGKYDADKILMVGDAEGDLKAARANNALFFPVNPGHEEASWKLFHDEAMGRFLAGTYAGAYERKLIDKFQTYLPETPPWKR